MRRADWPGVLGSLASGLVGALLGLLGGGALAWESRTTLPQTAPVVLDAKLMDPQGRVRRFRSDILGRGPTLVSFTYLGCKAQCPVSDLITGQVETLLERAGRSDASIVTLTLDPTGRVADLQTHAELIGAGPRRTLFGGDLIETAPLLDGLGVRFGTLEDHSLFFLVFDARGRFVSRVEFKDATAERLIERLDAAAASSGSTASRGP